LGNIKAFKLFKEQVPPEVLHKVYAHLRYKTMIEIDISIFQHSVLFIARRQKQTVLHSTGWEVCCDETKRKNGRHQSS